MRAGTLLLALGAAACLCCPAHAQQGSLFAEGSGKLFQSAKPATAPSGKAIRAELLSASREASPGQPLQLAVRLTHQPGWHTYWRNSGEAGAPTELLWKLPSGWKASDPVWPVPAVRQTLNVINYALSGTALLPVSVQVPSTAAGTARLSVTVSWIACKEQCVPGEQTVSIDVTAGKDRTPTPEAALIEEARRSAPSEAPAGTVAAYRSGERLVVAMKGTHQDGYFFPLAEGCAFKNETFLTSGGQSYLVLETPAGNPLSRSGALSGVLSLDSGKLALAVNVPVSAGLPPGMPAVSAGTAGSAGPSSFLAACLLALAGGLILNLMPCVFPVLSLKMLGLIKAAGGRSLLPHGIAFTLGVLASMGLLSGALVAMQSAGKAVGWGFQLQSPAVIYGLALLFTAISLNLAGLFEFTFGSRAAGELSMKAPGKGLAGSFFTGILAVIVASPCTAPFMGAAIGYALTQPPVLAIAIFMCLGAGMALPWLALSVFTGWSRWLPRPGRWMIAVRYCLAVPIALTAAWLLWVLFRQVSGAGFAMSLAGLAALSLALALFGRRQRTGRAGPAHGVLALSLAAALAVAAFLGTSGSRQADDIAAGWQAWSPEAVEAARASGRPVFVDFTAAWCMTCQVNQKLVLDAQAPREAFARHGYVKLLADWTRRDARIARELARYGHDGVPLYLVISPDGRTEVLPELLTDSLLAEALARGTQADGKPR